MATRTTTSLALVAPGVGEPVKAVSGPVRAANKNNLVANLAPAVCDDLVQAVFGNLLRLDDLVQAVFDDLVRAVSPRAIRMQR